MMPVDIVMWRQRIGIFNCYKLTRSGTFHSGNFLISECVKKFVLSVRRSLLANILIGLPTLFLHCVVLLFLFLVSFSLFLILQYLSHILSPGFHTPCGHFLNLSLVMALKISKFPDTLYESCNFVRCNMFYKLIVIMMLLFVSGSVELNPGPGHDLKSFSFAMWNLDSLPARDYSRIPIIEGLQSIYSFDLFAICESSLNDRISNEDLFIHGFSPDPLRADKAPGSRCGGVCIFFKENLPL